MTRTNVLEQVCIWSWCRTWTAARYKHRGKSDKGAEREARLEAARDKRAERLGVRELHQATEIGVNAITSLLSRPNIIKVNGEWKEKDAPVQPVLMDENPGFGKVQECVTVTCHS